MVAFADNILSLAFGGVDYSHRRLGDSPVHLYAVLSQPRLILTEMIPAPLRDLVLKNRRIRPLIKYIPEPCHYALTALIICSRKLFRAYPKSYHTAGSALLAGFKSS